MNATAEPTVVEDAAAAARRRHLVLRHRLRIDAGGLPILAAGVFVAAMVLTGVVSLRVDIRTSGWAVAAQIARWFVGAIGVYLTAVHLPLYVTHGMTRRRIAGDLGVFAPLYALLAAVGVSVGLLLEGLVYRLAGWEQGLDGHLFDSPGQVHLVMAEYCAAFLVWIAAGALLGAGFYRNPALGLVLLAPAVGAVVAVEAGIGAGVMLPPPIGELVGLADIGVLGPAAVVGAAVALAVVLAWLTWLAVRDVPIKSETP